MVDFLNKEVILWDFDGVIINSEEIRIYGFREVLKKYPQHQIDELIKFHKNNGGLSRFVKFRYFYEKIRNEKITESEVNSLAEKFSNIMLAKLPNKGFLINETMTFIRKNHKKIKMYIVSGSEEEELKKLCNRLEIEKYFVSIHGSPTPKNDLVKLILNQNQFLFERVLLIGDSINDYEAAEDNKIDFCGFNNPSLKNRGLNYINSFE